MASVLLPTTRWANGNEEVVVGRATIFAVLLVPVIGLAALSLLTFEARWIGVAVLVVGLVVAALGSVRPLKTAGLFLLLAIQDPGSDSRRDGVCRVRDRLHAPLQLAPVLLR
jgi:hypothetical protein